jgi:hypothetical protein
MRGLAHQGVGRCWQALQLENQTLILTDHYRKSHGSSHFRVLDGAGHLGGLQWLAVVGQDDDVPRGHHGGEVFPAGCRHVPAHIDVLRPDLVSGFPGGQGRRLHQIGQLELSVHNPVPAQADAEMVQHPAIWPDLDEQLHVERTGSSRGGCPEFLTGKYIPTLRREIHPPLSPLLLIHSR